MLTPEQRKKALLGLGKQQAKAIKVVKAHKWIQTREVFSRMPDTNSLSETRRMLARLEERGLIVSRYEPSRRRSWVDTKAWKYHTQHD